MEAKAAVAGSLLSRRLLFARVKPGTSALGRTPSVYISVFSSVPLDSVLLEDQYHGVHHL